MAHWELRPIATTQPWERGLNFLSLTWKRDQNSKFEAQVLLNVYITFALQAESSGTLCVAGSVGVLCVCVGMIRTKAW